MKLASIIFFLTLQVYSSTGQITGILLNTEEASEGYTLFFNSRFNSADVYLVDNCGEIINEWPNVADPELHPKILPNGNLVVLQDDEILQYDWDGSIAKRIQLNTSQNPRLKLVYETILMDNGNFLCIVRKSYSTSELRAMGLSFNGQNPSVLDGVVELDGASGDVVWEWNIGDHMIQDRDASVGNYGVVDDHPELVNIGDIGQVDWENYESFMINGFAYNEELDQIALSVRKMSEVMIIDHSTTTEEAASHSGGTSGKGGDILFRFGDPANYGRGSEDDRVLYFQHNPNWIKYGEHKGKIICFNNGLSRPNTTFDTRYSEAIIFDPTVDADGNFVQDADGEFLLDEDHISYSGLEDDARFYSSYTSGAVVQPNGNIYITVGATSQMMELAPNGDKVWEYQNPFRDYQYRSERYPLDYEGFEGQVLLPQGPLSEANSNYECELTTSTGVLELHQDLTLARISNRLYSISSGDYTPIEYDLHDVNGTLVRQSNSGGISHELVLDELAAGMYFLVIRQQDQSSLVTKKIIIR